MKNGLYLKDFRIFRNIGEWNVKGVVAFHSCQLPSSFISEISDNLEIEASRYRFNINYKNGEMALEFVCKIGEELNIEEVMNEIERLQDIFRDMVERQNLKFRQIEQVFEMIKQRED